MTKRKKITATIVLVLTTALLISLLCVSCNSKQNGNTATGDAGETVETGNNGTTAGSEAQTQAPLETATDATHIEDEIGGTSEEGAMESPDATTGNPTTEAIADGGNGGNGGTTPATTEKPNTTEGTTEAPTTTETPTPKPPTTETPTTTETPATTEAPTPKPPTTEAPATTEAPTPKPPTTEAPTTTEKPNTTEATTTHIHKWVARVINHPAVTHEETQTVCVQEAYDERVIDYYANVCNTCGFVDYPVGWAGMTIGEHCLMCRGKDEHGVWIGTSYHSQPFYKTVHHDAVYEEQTVTVVDKEAWTETYNECSECGARQ